MFPTPEGDAHMVQQPTPENPYPDPYGMAPPGDIAESALPPEQRRAMPEPPARAVESEPTETSSAPDEAARGEDPPAVHHIGIAVHSIEEAMQFWGQMLGLSVVDRHDLPERSLRVAFVRTGNTLLELLEPTDEGSTVARFLERRGPGMHHLCFGTPDIREHLRDLHQRGVDLVDHEPRSGAQGEVAFLQPAAAFGVLVELLQESPTLAAAPEPDPTV